VKVTPSNWRIRRGARPAAAFCVNRRRLRRVGDEFTGSCRAFSRFGTEDLAMSTSQRPSTGSTSPAKETA